MLELKNISLKIDNETILDNINLKAQKSKVTAILGPSGSGKSSLLKIIAGICQESSGDIYFDKENINQLSAYDRNIGYVSQNPSLLPFYNVWQNIALPLDKLSKKVQKDKAYEILKLIDLQEFAEKYPNQLSIGQQQRISIARALVKEPKIILFDEPYANIDPLNKDLLIRKNFNLMKKFKAVKLLISHDPHEAMLAADNIYVLQAGKISQSGTIEELYSKPKNDFIARIFGMVNLIPADIDGDYAQTIFGNLSLDSYRLINQQLIIRPEELKFVKNKSKNSLNCKIIDKKFYYGQYLYFLENDNHSEIIKLISSDNQRLNSYCQIGL
jgi:ABC-type sugar transport system ATPase subunit